MAPDALPSESLNKIKRLILPEPSSPTVQALSGAFSDFHPIPDDIFRSLKRTKELGIDTRIYPGFWGIAITIGDPSSNNGWAHCSCYIPGLPQEQRWFIRIEKRKVPDQFKALCASFDKMWSASSREPKTLASSSTTGTDLAKGRADEPVLLDGRDRQPQADTGDQGSRERFQRIADTLAEAYDYGLRILHDGSACDNLIDLSVADVPSRMDENFSNVLLFMENFECPISERLEIKGVDISTQRAESETAEVERVIGNYRERLMRMRAIAKTYQGLAHNVTPSTSDSAAPPGQESEA